MRPLCTSKISRAAGQIYVLFVVFSTTKRVEVIVTHEAIEHLIHTFRTRTVPLTEWTHAAHLIVALWFLMHNAQPEATAQIRVAIQQYNAAMGIPTTPDRGYHETITLFWIRMVQQYLVDQDPARPIADLANELIHRYPDKNVLHRYYSQKRLMSWEARVNWVEPDLLSF